MRGKAEQFSFFCPTFFCRISGRKMRGKAEQFSFFCPTFFCRLRALYHTAPRFHRLSISGWTLAEAVCYIALPNYANKQSIEPQSNPVISNEAEVP
jgi:hypothetical protein